MKSEVELASTDLFRLVNSLYVMADALKTRVTDKHEPEYGNMMKAIENAANTVWLFHNAATAGKPQNDCLQIHENKPWLT